MYVAKLTDYLYTNYFYSIWFHQNAILVAIYNTGSRLHIYTTGLVSFLSNATKSLKDNFRFPGQIIYIGPVSKVTIH